MYVNINLSHYLNNVFYQPSCKETFSLRNRSIIGAFPKSLSKLSTNLMTLMHPQILSSRQQMPLL